MDSFLNNMNSILDAYAPLKKFNKYRSSRQNPVLLLPFRNQYLLKITY